MPTIEEASVLITNATTRLWTREEFSRLVDGGFFGPEERVELIEGEIVVLAPAGPEHSNPIRYGTMVLARLYGETHDVAVQLPLNLDQCSQPQPDFALIARGTVPRGKLPTTADLVIEVSVTSLAFDRKEKLALYARAGIPEYWIVDVEGRMVEVYSEPISLSDASFGFAHHRLFRPDQKVQPLRIDGPPFPLSCFFEDV